MSWAKLCLEDESRKTFLSSSVLVELKLAKFGKLSSGHGTGRGRFSFQSQKREMPKNAQTATQWHSFHMLSFTFHMIILKILQARLQQYVNWEIPDIQAGFRKGKGTRYQIANMRWIKEKQGNSRKTSTSASLTMLSLCLCRSQKNWGKFLKRLEYPTTLPISWETCM